MRSSALIRTLGVCADLRRPAFISGAPGIGKSDVVRQLAKNRGLVLSDIRLAQMDPTDLKGLPKHATRGAGKKLREVAAWSQPDFLPTDGEGILFLDELPQAAPSVQNAAYQLILDRRLGDYVLPDGWSIIAAGNRAGDRTNAHTMGSALRSRFVHYTLEVDNADWKRWADGAGISSMVTGFLDYRPALLHNFDPKTNPTTYPCPRTWSFVSEFVKNDTLGETELNETVTGLVGEGAAVEFSGYMRVFRGLPTVAEILKNPTKIPMPEKVDGMYAASSMLVEHANTKTFEPLMQYIGRLPVEYQVCFIRSVLIRNQALTNHKVTGAWISQNSDVFVG